MSNFKKRPILFSAEMVRAILDSRKTQTRRIVTPQPPPGHIWGGWSIFSTHTADEGKAVWAKDSGLFLNDPHRVGCPHGQPGDRLWVRETHRPIFGQSGGLIAIDYKADPREKWERLGDDPNSLVKPTKWIPSIHMRREYSRIDLKITDVRVERLNDISEADCIADGIPWQRCTDWKGPNGTRRDFGPQDAYRELWESLNGPGSWGLNQWVWVIEFRRVE